MQAVIMAGGYGTRLYPTTLAVSKHLLPVYDRPMIYFPIMTMMLAGVTDILIIVHPPDLPHYQELLQDGKQWGLHIQFAVQEKPVGIIDNLTLAKDFLTDEKFWVILGDNVFLPANEKVIHAFSVLLRQAGEQENNTVFSYQTNEPARYGMAVYKNKKLIEIVEKPEQLPSHDAITGLYRFDQSVYRFIEEIASVAGSLAKTNVASSLENLCVTDINNYLIQKNKLDLIHLPEDLIWFDAGTPEDLFHVSEKVREYELSFDQDLFNPVCLARELGL